MYGGPPPMFPKLKSDVMAEATARDIIDSLIALAYTQKFLCPYLSASYEAASPPTPHKYLQVIGCLATDIRNRVLNPRRKDFM